jgi:hypothetical protein
MFYQPYELVTCDAKELASDQKKQEREKTT